MYAPLLEKVHGQAARLTVLGNREYNTSVYGGIDPNTVRRQHGKMAQHKTLILLRHGESQAPAGVYYGRKDYLLTQRGLEQAKQASQRLRGMKITKVFSSPLRRCLQTARLCCPGVPVTALDELNDLDFGLWEEMPIEQAMQDAQAWQDWTARGRDNAPPEGESLAAFSERCMAALERILAETADGGCSLVVTQYGNLRSITAGALAMGDGGAARLVCAPGSLACLDIMDGMPVLSRWNA